MMTKMHSLLKRQLKQHFDNLSNIPIEWQGFISAVNKAYYQADSDRNMLERSLDLSSQELLQANAEMRAVFLAFPDMFFWLDADGKIIDCKGGSSIDYYLPPEKLIGKRIQDFPQKVIAKKFSHAIQFVQKNKSMINLEYSLNSNKVEHYYEARFLPLLENTSIMIVRNITDRRKAEEAVKDRERFLHNIFESIQDGISVLDKDLNIIRVNQAMRNWYVDMLPLTDKKCYQAYHGRTEQCTICPTIRALKTGKLERDEVVLNQGGQNTGTMELFAFPILDDLKHPTGVVEYVRDITERKRAEEQLIRLSNAVAMTTDSIIISNLERNIIDVNEAALKLFRASDKNELIGKNTLDLVTLEERQSVLTDIQTVLEKGHVEAREFNIITLEKHTKPVERSIALMKDVNDKPIGFVDVSRDITERKLAEEERVRLATAIYQTGEIIIITDAEGGILYANPAFEKTTGYTIKEVIGKNPRFLSSCKLDKIFYKKMWQTITSGKVWTGQFINKRKDGSIYYEEATISPVRNTLGQIINYVAVKHDVTHEIELENYFRQTQKMEAIGTLAGGIAHDFNNILAPIMGYVEMMMLDLSDDDQHRKYLDVIYAAAVRARELVKQILAFSRQSDKELKPLKIQLILKEVLKLSRASLPASIEIISKTNNSCNPILADPTEIHQIALNLITNAYHAIEEDHGTIEVALDEVELSTEDLKDPNMKTGKYVCLSIKDTGHGIEDGILDKIFDPYFTTKEKGKGTGLGLSIVHGIVKSYGGDIKVESELKKGTNFYVYLPCLPDHEIPSEVYESESLDSGHERILLIDDENKIIEMLQHMLEYLGYQVTSFTNSMDAFETFRLIPYDFDLVITDMTMPQMDGIQLSKNIMTIRPEIPIMICTGFNERINEKRAKALGIRGFIMKPVVMNEFSQKIRTLLKESERVTTE